MGVEPRSKLPFLPLEIHLHRQPLIIRKPSKYKWPYKSLPAVKPLPKQPAANKQEPSAPEHKIFTSALKVYPF